MVIYMVGFVPRSLFPCSPSVSHQPCHTPLLIPLHCGHIMSLRECIVDCVILLLLKTRLLFISQMVWYFRVAAAGIPKHLSPVSYRTVFDVYTCSSLHI